MSIKTYELMPKHKYMCAWVERQFAADCSFYSRAPVNLAAAPHSAAAKATVCVRVCARL